MRRWFAWLRRVGGYPIRLSWGLVLLASGLVIGFALGGQLGGAARCRDTGPACAEFAVLAEVWQLARRHYHDPERAAATALNDAAITAIISQLDDPGHTRYLNPEAARRFEQRLSNDAATLTMTRGDSAILTVAIGSFYDGLGEDLAAGLRRELAQPTAGIILDLRDCPGGFIDELLRVAGEVLPPGTPVFAEVDRFGTLEEYQARGAGLAAELPLVVLINEDTASAGEILAGALQAAARAPLLGQPTAGTSTILNRYRLSNDGLLLLGTTRWQTPDGYSARERGIVPDQLVPDAQILEVAAELLASEAALFEQ